MKKHHSPSSPDEILENTLNLNKFKTYLANFKGNREQFFKELSYGDFIQSALDIPEKEMGQFYHEGHQFFSAKNYEQAAKYFFSLVLFDQARYEYWLSLAHALFFMEKYEKALQAYAAASLLKQDDPNPPYYGGICLLMLGKNEEALHAFDASIEIAHQEGNSKIEDSAKQQKNHILKLQKGGSQ